ncbi:hypothetical protein, partial [Enterococcus innesii]|uniref:hypothetical protein n=1 Tax=Enterococcus innesii TaxID=2839759 RepID=UPI0034A1020B
KNYTIHPGQVLTIQTIVSTPAKPAITTTPKVESKPAITTTPKVESKPGVTTTPKVDEKPVITTIPKVKEQPVVTTVPKTESEVLVEKASGAGKTSKEVEIIDKNGSPLGEFDEIDLNKGIFYEDKTAKGLDVVNPRTGLPTQTPQQFADKQIYQKTVNRIKNLDIAEATRPTVNGSQSIPSLEEIKGVRKFVFRLDGNSAELQSAVNQSIAKLQSEFPDYTFEVIFGGK